jgi:glucose-1-phosphatase
MVHTTIRLVVFDMDDVLCRYDRPKRVALLAALAGKRPEEVHQAIWGSGFEDLSDAGALDAESYLAGFGARIGYPLTLTEWIDARRAAMTPDAAMLALAAEVKRKVAVALLTNNGLLTRATIGDIFPELPPLFGERLFCAAQFAAAATQVPQWRAQWASPEKGGRRIDRTGILISACGAAPRLARYAGGMAWPK